MSVEVAPVVLAPVHRYEQMRSVNGYSILAGVPHGRRGSYVRGCRCDDCRDAEALYNRSRDRSARPRRRAV